jgi:hypothetical protein
MAVGASKTWVAGEILTASDLNSEFLNVYNNGETLGWPATVAKDFAGNALILDAGGGTTLHADTNNKLDMTLAGTDLYDWDGTGTTPINGLKFTATATTVDTKITVKSVSDSNVSLDIIPLGTGVFKVDGDEVATILGSQFFS